jgi:tetratricopeptide (TPR) repeat protein
MDESSTELLRQIAVAAADRRWLLVLARRAAEGGFTAPERVEVVDVLLEPLEAEAVRELLHRLTAEAPLPRHVSATIAERAGGSPLFVTELVAAVQGGADLDALPDSVEALMSVQIDALASADRALLRQASVLGARFARTSFETALGLDEAEAEGALARLDGLLVPDGEGGIRFRHGLLRDAAYHGLSFRRRRELHRRVAESFEAGDDAALLADRLALHYFEAGVWDKALAYGVAAGAEARAVHANADAATLLERAVAAGRSSRTARTETVARAAEALGNARLSLGELARARTAFAMAGRRVRNDPVERARLLRKEATVLYRLGAAAKAQRAIAAGLELLAPIRSVPAAVQRARLEAWLGVVLVARGRPRAALEWLERAVADGEAVGAKKAVAHALVGLDLAYSALGDSARLGNARRALALYDELGDLGSKGGTLNNLGTSAYYAGRWNEALELYRAALDAWERAGDTQSVSLAAFNVGESLSAQGRLSDAEPLLRNAERVSRATGSATSVANDLLETALLDARMGRIDAAIEQLEEARRSFASVADRTSILLVEARTAETLLLGGEPERGRELATKALVRATADDAAALVVPVLYRLIGQAHLLAGRASEARAALDLALTEAARVGHRYEEALALDALVRAEGAEPAASALAARDELFEQLGIVDLPGPWAAAPARPPRRLRDQPPPQTLGS